MADRLEQVVVKLDMWSEALGEAACKRFASQGSGRQWLHSSIVLMDAVRMAAELRGGASKFLKVLNQAISLTAPSFLVGTLHKALRKHGCRKPPSCSTTARAQFAVDLAMLDVRKQHYIRDCFRYMWYDSSEMGGVDWFWAIVHEIERCHVVANCKSVMALAELTSQFCGA